MRYLFMLTAAFFSNLGCRFRDFFKNKRVRKAGVKILEIVLLYGIAKELDHPELLVDVVRAIGQPF